jgi:hypothetical protein
MAAHINVARFVVNVTGNIFSAMTSIANVTGNIADVTGNIISVAAFVHTEPDNLGLEKLREAVHHLIVVVQTFYFMFFTENS